MFLQRNNVNAEAILKRTIVPGVTGHTRESKPVYILLAKVDPLTKSELIPSFTLQFSSIDFC